MVGRDVQSLVVVVGLRDGVGEGRRREVVGHTLEVDHGITTRLGVVGCEEGVGGTLAFEAGDPVPEGVAGLVEVADV